MNNRPGVGVGVIILKHGKVLFGKRKSRHGEGTWCPPGGHVEFGETLEQSAKRETFEEAGIQIKNLRRGPYTEDFHKEENKHYITPFIIADYDSGVVTLMEPEKCERWEWFAWAHLPQPLFLSIKNLIVLGFDPSKFE